MATMNYYWHEPVLPWSETDNDQRFKKILRLSLILGIIFGLIMPFLPAPKPEQKRLEQISPRLAKLIIEKKKQKPPVPKIIKKKIRQKPIKKHRAARKKAQQSGLLAMQSELADLQSAFDMSSLTNSAPLSKAVTARTSSRESLDKSAKRSSGGINTGSLSTTTGGGSLAGRRREVVKSNIGTGGAQSHRQRSLNSRAKEEIALVFEKNKSAVNSLYNRALRRDPSLQGKVVLELTIAPNGKITKCRIISSELNNASLERKLVARVKLFRFAAKAVKTVTVTYPIDFFPS